MRFSTADEPLHAGTGLKPPDRRLVPLCRECHRLEDAGKLRIDIAPLSGAQVQDLVQKLYATPNDVVARAQRLITP